MKDKRGSTVADTLGKLFVSTSLSVQLVQSDYGTEFYSHEMQIFFKERNIKHYSSLNYDVKAAVVEPFNRMLKCKIHWHDPNEVNFNNDDTGGKRLYPLKPKPKCKYNVRDKVRISRAR